MASADGSILIRTKVDTNGIKTGTNAIQSGVGKINNSLLKLGGTIAAVFSVYKLVEFGKQAVNLASDLQEVQNVVDVAFGDMSYKIEQFADSAIENFGLSELSAKTMASTFMAMANGMKQGLDVASDMAVEMTGRLADIMSFYNKSISEVETIGRAVYSGETEPLKQIGVIMTEAQLQTFALAHGYQQLYKDMSAADKLLVRQQYFLETTNQAAGDFVRTQDSWANQTRILSERWKEFLTLIGGRLIQVLTPAVNILNNLLTAAINLGNAMANVFGWQVQQSTAAGTTAGYVEDTASSQEDVASATNETNKALKKQLAFFDDINVLSSESASGAGTSTGGTTGGGIGGGVSTDQSKKELTKFEKDLLDFFDKVRKAIEPTTEAFKKLWSEGLQLLGKFTYGTLQDFYNDFLVPISKWTFGEGLPRLILAFNDLLKSIDWSGLRTALDEFYRAVEPLAENIGEGVLWFIENALNPLATYVVNEVLITFIEDLTAGIELLNTAIDNLSPYWNKFWDVFGSDAYSANMEAIGSAILKIFNPLKALNDLVNDFNGQNIIDYFTSIFDLSGILTQPQFALTIEATGQAWGETLAKKLAESFGITGGLTMSETIDTVFGWLFSLENWSAILSNIQLAFETKWNELVEWWDSVILVFWESNVLPWFSIEKWTMIGQNMQNGIKAGFKGIVGWIVGVLNGIIDGFEAMVNFVVEGANTLVDKFNSLPSAVRLGYTASRFSKVNFGNIPIPALAQGAVIPANKEFMAILGDQKSGVNIETPLQTMIDAFNTALNNRGGNNSGTVINLNVDGQTFARLTLDSFMSEMTRQGYDVAVLGG